MSQVMRHDWEIGSNTSRTLFFEVKTHNRRAVIASLIEKVGTRFKGPQRFDGNHILIESHTESDSVRTIRYLSGFSSKDQKRIIEKIQQIKNSRKEIILCDVGTTQCKIKINVGQLCHLRTSS